MLFAPDIEIYEREATTAGTVDDGSATDDNANAHIFSTSDGVRRYAVFGTADGSAVMQRAYTVSSATSM